MSLLSAPAPADTFRLETEPILYPRLTALALCILGTLVLTEQGAAQCAFDAPARAKSIRSDMTRVFGYGTSTSCFFPNTSTSSGLSACTPPLLRSPSFLFNEKGRCSFKAKHRRESSCIGGGAQCSNIEVQAKCSGITSFDETTPVEGPGWRLFMLLRLTFNDPTGGDQTVFDFPFSYDFPPAERGKLSVKGNANEILEYLFGPGNSLPSCTNAELISPTVRSPEGAFAVMGTSTR